MDDNTKSRLDQQFAFLREIDQEKFIERQTLLTDGKRRENDAEHAWHMAVMAILFAEYANEEIDLLHTLKMILLHDVVEVYAGDTYAYDEAGKASQREREEKAADQIYALLPDDQEQSLRALWEEFEARKTPEAKFARALDNFQPLMLNYATDGKAWLFHDIALSQVLRRNERSGEGARDVWAYVLEHFIRPSAEAGWLRKDQDIL